MFKNIKNKLSDILFYIKYFWRNRKVLNIKNKKIKFDTSKNRAKRWFYPRYEKDGNFHEPPVTKKLVGLLEKDHVFFDVGSYMGHFSIIAAHFTKKEVHSFELDPKLTKYIKRNKEINNTENLKINNFAIYSKPGKTVTYKPNQTNNKSTNYLSSKNEDQKRSVTKTIDGYCEKEKVYPDIIKIDVEGAEFNVLRGMKNTLEKQTPKYIFLEIHPSLLENKFETSTKEVINLLKDNNYTIEKFSDHRSHDSKLEKIDSAEEIKENTVLLCKQK